MTPQFGAIFFRHLLRNFARHKALALINLLSVALGVAVYLAVRIAAQSASDAFAAGVDVVAGKAHLEVRGDVPETVLPEIVRHERVRAATPLIEAVVTLPDFPGEYLRVLGVDPFTNEPFRTFEWKNAFPVEEWLSTRGGIAVSEKFARQHKLESGARLRALVNGRIETLEVITTFEPGPIADRHLALMDIGWAQELFGMRGRLSSIQLLLREPLRAEAVARALTKLLPPHVNVAAPQQRSVQVEKMLSAFKLNLTALSLVSLLVGAFLIYNSVSAAVVRQRRSIGILRALGASRLGVRSLFLGEALVMGAAGAVVGLAGGVLLARLMVSTVSETISSLYILVSVERLSLDASSLAIAGGLGLLAVVAGAWLPSIEASNVEPVEALQRGRSSRSHPIRNAAAAALVAFLAAVVCAALAFKVHRLFSFASAFFLLGGFALLSPILIRAKFPRLLKRPLIFQLAADNLRRSARRNAVTVAALATAIAMTIGVSVMVYSFRTGVNDWIARSVVADVFIAPASNEVAGLSAFVPPELLTALRANADVQALDTFREITIFPRLLQQKWRPGPVSLAVVTGAERRNLRFIGGGARKKLRNFAFGNVVLVTESFARRFGTNDGEKITIPTPQGLTDFEIAGTYRDYTNDRGVVLMHRNVFDRYWNDPRVQSLAIHLRSHIDADTFVQDFRARYSSSGEFSVYSNKKLRERIFEIFDQTFAVTYVLRAIAIIVAVVGIFLSLSTLVLERQREIAVLRSIGASRGQVASLFLAESGLIGLAATVLGCAGGISLAVVLTRVVNPAFFGWTIDFELPVAVLLSAPLWILPISLIAGMFPALRAAQASPAKGLRYE